MLQKAGSEPAGEEQEEVGSQVKRRGLRGRGGDSEEGVAPLPQTLSAGSGLTGVRSAGVFEPLGEHLSVFLQQQELTQNHVGLKTHENTQNTHEIHMKYT